MDFFLNGSLKDTWTELPVLKIPLKGEFELKSIRAFVIHALLTHFFALYEIILILALQNKWQNKCWQTWELVKSEYCILTWELCGICMWALSLKSIYSYFSRNNVIKIRPVQALFPIIIKVAFLEFLRSL